jgi:hypothetical protein
MVDDLTGDEDDAAGRIAVGGEERNLGFGVQRVLGLRVRRLAGVSSPELEEV